LNPYLDEISQFLIRQVKKKATNAIFMPFPEVFIGVKAPAAYEIQN